jgi:hydrogenase maturation protein HypF
VCGPRVHLWDPSGNPIESDWIAIEQAAALIRSGLTVAVKDVGGFHLMCDASNAETVNSLRVKKRREEKPFALLMPSIEVARKFADLNDSEQQALASSAAPIVLVQRTAAAEAFREAVAPENPFLGIMLPSNPLQHLLMNLLQITVVATSGNLTDEPICIDEGEAVQRLHGIADAFLVHDRPILRHADDSIVRHLLGREQVLRRARGFAPLPIHTGQRIDPMIAVGAHLKNTVAVAADHRIVISQHIGDLETAEAADAFARVAVDLLALHGIKPQQAVCDLHPDYRSSQHARACGLPVREIQHHLAHVAACMGENELRPPVLGISWDGTGLGTDGTIWGGEFIRVETDRWDRLATLRPFRLPGGDAAVKEPRRSALSVLTVALGPEIFARYDLATIAAFDPGELRPLQHMIERGVRSPVTTSAGRLFDAVASIVGLRQRVRHEGQAAMELEWTARSSKDPGSYPLPMMKEDDLLLLDWGPMVREILNDLARSVGMADIARRFHAALADGMLTIARATGIRTVALSGGCFQNGLLTELAVTRLRAKGFDVFWHQRVPPNDGAIAVGQIMAASMDLVERKRRVAVEESA